MKMSSNQFCIPQPLTVASSAITPLVSKFRELEYAKLDIRIRGGEMPGVKDVFFDEVLDMCNVYPGWGDVSEWVNSHDYIYTVDSRQIKTSVTMDDSVSVTHATKQTIDMVDLDMRTHGRARVCLATFEPVLPDEIPETVTPTGVHIKQTKMYTASPWRFYLTRVWSGGTRTEAEQAQSGGTATYRIRIRFEPDQMYWEIPHHIASYVASSMLMKMVDILSPDMIGVDLIK